MHISHLIVSLNRGGQERVVVDLASEQIKSGANVSIICLNEIGSLFKEAIENGIKVYDCQKKSALDFKALKKIRNYLKNNNSQVLHTHNAVANYYGAAARIGTGVKCIINTRHGNGPTQGKQVERLFSYSMKFTDHCICVAETARSNFLKSKILSAKNSSVIYNGITLDQNNVSSSNKNKLQKKLGLSTSIVIGSVGRLATAKDFPLLIKAFSIVNNKYDSTLIIIGDGSERSIIEKEIINKNLQDKVMLLGDRPDARQLLPAFDIYAVSSVTEGFSIAILEACACNLPIVATNVGGNAEILQNGKNGKLVPHDKPEALAHEIEQLIIHPEQSLKLAHSGYTWVQDNCSVSKMASAYQDVYQKFM